MIGSIRGQVTHVGADHALVEVGGIGYRVVAGPALLARLRAGSEASVFTHHLVREDQQALFGFATTEELAFFELLMTVSQVGPDKYRGRIDAVVATRDTPDVAAALLKGGFARSYDGGRREPWC